MKNPVRKFRLRYLFILSDLILVFGLTLLSLFIYYDNAVVFEHLTAAMIYTVSVSAFVVILFAVSKIYRMLVKDIGLFECAKIFSISFIVQFFGYLVIIFAYRVPGIPDAFGYLFIWLFSSIVISFVLVCERLLFRAINIVRSMSSKKNKVRTLVIGAGAAGKIVVDESRRNKDNHNLVVAFVDDDVNKIGGNFANLPVKGPISSISTIIDFYDIQEVIIAISDLTQEKLHEIVSILDLCPVRVRRLPIIGEMEGPNDTRIIDVDLNDLLSRDPVILDNHEVN